MPTWALMLFVINAGIDFMLTIIARMAEENNNLTLCWLEGGFANVDKELE